MNYIDAKYSMFWGYGPNTLSRWMESPGILQDAVDSLINELSASVELASKANLFESRVKVKETRQSAYVCGHTITNVLRRDALRCVECGMYVFDSSYSKANAPRVFLNIHAGGGEELAGRVLVMPDRMTRAGTFVIFAVTSGMCAAQDFTALARATCNRLELVYAYVFQNVGYKYDGLTPLEWAYKNHSAKLRSGQLTDLVPSMGMPLHS